MSSQLLVHLHEVSEVALNGTSAGKAAFDVTVEVNGAVLTSSTKRNPSRSVFMEEFKFMVNADEPCPEVTMRIYEAPHEGTRKELGSARLQPKESGKTEVLLRALTNAVVAKAAVTVTLPPKKPEPEPEPQPEKPARKPTGVPRTLLYIAAAVAAVLILAVVGEYAFSGRPNVPEGYGKLRFQRLLAGEYITGCVHAFDVQPAMSTRPSTYPSGQLAQDEPPCTNVVLHMQYNGNLVLSHGTSPRNKTGLIWASRTGRWWWRSKHYAAEMSPEGMIVITRKNKVLWMNPFSIFPELRCVLSPV